MIIAAVIVAIIAIALIILIEFIDNAGKGDMSTGIFFGVLISMLFIIELGIISDIIGKPKPTAKSVYEGKTTLEITYKDGIPIDTVVVLKPEFIKK